MKFYGSWLDPAINSQLFNPEADGNVHGAIPNSLNPGKASFEESSPTVIRIIWIFQNSITPAAGKTTKAQVESAIQTPGTYNLIDEFEDCTHCTIEIYPSLHHDLNQIAASVDYDPEPTVYTTYESNYSTALNFQRSYNFTNETYLAQSPDQVSQTGHSHSAVLNSTYVYTGLDTTRNQLGVIPQTLYLTDSTGA